MKVKIGQLKTHLSSYVKTLQEGGDPIEVCIREDTVAYLTASDRPKPVQDLQRLGRDLGRSGLTVSQWGRRKLVSHPPASSEGGQTESNSVLEMRREKDW